MYLAKFLENLQDTKSQNSVCCDQRWSLETCLCES